MVQCLQRAAQAVLNKNSVIAKEGSKKGEMFGFTFCQILLNMSHFKKKIERKNAIMLCTGGTKVPGWAFRQNHSHVNLKED